MKRIVLMADGKGTRWNEYLDVPKHLAEVRGEKLLERTVRLLREAEGDFEIIVTSHDPRYEFEGSARYEPLNNVYEIDRFTEELIISDMCFLYGDTFYSEETLNKILTSYVDELMFFGNSESIVAIRISDQEQFKKHIANVKNLYLSGQIEKCVGWQVYRSFTNQGYDEPIIFDNNFVFVDDMTVDIDTPHDYELIEK